MPTFVYVDEAADYFDRNIGLILAQARKYKVGMVLAHQYLGQLEPKLQDAFAANTAIKFAGGVSQKDARALAPMLHTSPEMIERQRKGSFAAAVRSQGDGAVPLSFPLGFLEDLPRMQKHERDALRTTMRERYAIHYTKLGEDEDADEDDAEQPREDAEGTEPDTSGTAMASDTEGDADNSSETPKTPPKNDPSTEAGDTW